MAQKEVALDIRLRNCLQTILELEEGLTNSDFGSILGKDFLILKGVVEKLEYSFIEEKDVQRIEEITKRFLEEVQQNLTISKASLFSGSQLLQ